MEGGVGPFGDGRGGAKSDEGGRGEEGASEEGSSDEESARALISVRRVNVCRLKYRVLILYLSTFQI